MKREPNIEEKCCTMCEYFCFKPPPDETFLAAYCSYWKKNFPRKMVKELTNYRGEKLPCKQWKW